MKIKENIEEDTKIQGKEPKTDYLDVVKEEIAKILGVNFDQIEPDTELTQELGASSFDYVDILVALEDNYNLRLNEVTFSRIRTARCLANNLKKQDYIKK